MSLSQQTSKYVSVFQSQFPDFEIIPDSVSDKDQSFLAIVRKGHDKMLLIGAEKESQLPQGFHGEKLNSSDAAFLICKRTHENAEALRSVLPHTKPVTLGNANSFGFGDRLGNAGPAHLKALMDSQPFFLPILAQQSIRELDRTGRSAEEVMDAATWAVLQVGYKNGFGSDADHLKTTRDIDRMINAGYNMFTIDPSDYVDNRSQSMNEDELHSAFLSLAWDKLRDEPEPFLERYAGKHFQLEGGVSFKPSKTDILRAAVKYGNVVIHTCEMYQYMKDNYPNHDTEVELSVDETPHPTTPEEHLVIASELQRLNVELVSLAPRFCGDFEKGIDFKGDLNAFRDEYLLHQAIAAQYGNYKLSIHSGSDKFGVYEAIGELNVGNVHVKTAGTSYLEALRAIAMCDAGLFREIMAFSIGRFDTDRKTYHISADLSKMDRPEDISDENLPALLDDDNARQVFHVTFGSVLTQKTGDEKMMFRDRMMAVMSEYEDVYEECLYKHFRKHIKPFEKK